ncbi:hypothetical protein GCM10027174_13870 [Salinifilum aidingensis]
MPHSSTITADAASAPSTLFRFSAIVEFTPRASNGSSSRDGRDVAAAAPATTVDLRDARDGAHFDRAPNGPDPARHPFRGGASARPQEHAVSRCGHATRTTSRSVSRRNQTAQRRADISPYGASLPHRVMTQHWRENERSSLPESDA